MTIVELLNEIKEAKLRFNRAVDVYESAVKRGSTSYIGNEDTLYNVAVDNSIVEEIAEKRMTEFEDELNRLLEAKKAAEKAIEITLAKYK